MARGDITKSCEKISIQFHPILTVVDLQNLKIHYPWIYLCDIIELKLSLTLSVTL